MTWRWTLPQVSSGKTSFRSRSVCSTLLPLVSPQRAASRWTWVSTGKAARPNAWLSTTEAVLWPTPGSASRASSVRGTSPPCSAARIAERRLRFFALVSARPMRRISRLISSTGRAARAAGVGARAKRAGVTSLTSLSVVWAESTTATSSVNGSWCRRGTSTAGKRRSRIPAMRCALSRFVIRGPVLPVCGSYPDWRETATVGERIAPRSRLLQTSAGSAGSAGAVAELAVAVVDVAVETLEARQGRRDPGAVLFLAGGAQGAALDVAVLAGEVERAHGPGAHQGAMDV